MDDTISSPPYISAEPVEPETARFAADFVAEPGTPLTHEAAGLYRLLVESVRDYAIFALNPTGHILSWNQGAERFKGYTRDEILGKHFSIFYPEEDKAWGKPAWELEVAARDGRLEDEGWRIRKDGSRFWANVVITALHDDSGALVGFTKVTRDLTERRAAEEALRESEERFRLMVQSVKDYAIFMLDPTGHIASWNEGAQRIKGYTADEIIGKHFSIFYTDEEKDWKPPMELEVAGQVGRFEDEGWRLRKDGTRFWANVIITALRNARGELIGFGKVTRDLTERKAAEEEAIENARRLAEVEASNRTRSEFLASMSHELRTPLNAIGGYTELLALGVRGPITEEQRHDLERIRQSQVHLLSIINDILNYSRIEAGQVRYDVTAVPLAQAATAVLPMVEPQALAKGLTVRVEDCPGGAVARADETKVEQILINLLTNAVKFTPEGGRITVTCLHAGRRVRVSVADTGIGIPEDEVEAVFEPFVQLGRSLTTGHEGTGLGLAISRDLARAMGGDLTLRSELGKGSTFTLFLPAATGDEPEKAAPATAAEPEPSTS
ncbi:MAG TPA: PAS domain S-box protein [Longimicrobiaceae bacterium]|nr:PAS domain S-box protein [Longimicrobiaceae bacterium]